jgi:hypothetical protein
MTTEYQEKEKKAWKRESSRNIIKNGDLDVLNKINNKAVKKRRFSFKESTAIIEIRDKDNLGFNMFN